MTPQRAGTNGRPSAAIAGLCAAAGIRRVVGFAPPFVVATRRRLGGSASSHPTFSAGARRSSSAVRVRMIYAPPSSGYAEREDETNFLPESYEPMMQYPGTMRPGTTPENQPYETLPLSESDPEPVPWPHFQEIEWHHQWGSPHEHPITMEDWIDMHGRWATVEEEAAMRAGARRDVRERREMEEMGRGATLIMDDDEDEEGGAGAAAGVPERMDLGDGVDVLIGSEAAAAPAAPKVREEDVIDEEEEDEGEDDFLLDLGLDSDDEDAGDDAATDDDEGGDDPAFGTAGGDDPQSLMEAMQSLIEEEGDESVEEEEDDDIDLSLDLGLDDTSDDNDDQPPEDDDDMGDLIMMTDDDEDDVGGGGGTTLTSGGVDTVPLDELSEAEGMDDDEGFDDGGFDNYGDEGGADGADVW